MPRALKILGLVAAIAVAVSPDLTKTNPSIARYVMLVGLATAAVHRVLSRRRARRRARASQKKG